MIYLLVFLVPDSNEHSHNIVPARDQPCNNFYDRNLLHRDRKLLHRVWCHHMTRWPTGNRHETNPNPTLMCSTSTTPSEIIIFACLITSDVIILVTVCNNFHDTKLLHDFHYIQIKESPSECLWRTAVPLVDSSCTKNRFNIHRMVQLYVMNRVIIFITKLLHRAGCIINEW